jgi:hypothetical protein
MTINRIRLFNLSWLLSPLSDNIKDMQMNFAGSVLFVLCMIYESQKV